ncbi:hypothetical protein [Micromonospora sp. URMC 103]|uniref:hypothetical protein n=1 Tax=Micromonospora sp. URMC 103 TaxID=3423406 RepID=UPI003F1CA036
MPAPDIRRSPTLLTVLFWSGVGLAPVAALILLVADGNGPLRFAAVLAILAVVLIGLSIALRRDGDGGEARVEELLDEMDQLRRELRGEIVAAAQRGNQALDQAQRAQEAVAAVRRRLEATGAALSGAEEPAGRARVPVAEPHDDEPARRSPPGGYDTDRPASGQYGGDRPAAAGVYGGERPDAGVYGGERAGSGGRHGGGRASAPQAGVYGAAPRPPEHTSRPEPASRPVGMVRHTETVHVTTRHTIVDGGSPEPAGGRYGGGYAGGWSPPAEERPWGAAAEDRWAGAGKEPEERPWSGYGGAEERSRPGDDRRWGAHGEPRDEPGWDDPRDDRARRDERDWSAADDRGWSAPSDERGWSASPDERGWPEQRGGAGESRWGDPPDDRPAQPDDTGQYWAQLRAGDRWAAVRDDDRGQELRMGERRAEVHADATGTEYRVADRWASVRRDDPRRDDPPRDDPRTYGRGGDAGRRGGWDEPEERAALPVGGVPVPDEWRPPRQRGYQSAPDEPERVGRRARVEEERYGYPPQDDAPRAGGTRWR